MVEGLAQGHENAVFGLDRSWMRWKMAASSSEFAVAQTLSEIAAKREVLMTAIGETLGFPFSDPFRPPTELAATAISMAAVAQSIRRVPVHKSPECLDTPHCCWTGHFVTKRFCLSTLMHHSISQMKQICSLRGITQQ